MRIVSKQEFYKLPKGTICAKYEPQVLGEPFIKLEVWYDADGNPFEYLEQPLWGWVESDGSANESRILHNAEITGASFKMDYEVSTRDGMFDKKQMYAVWEEEDVQGVINLLQKAKTLIPR